MTVIKSRWLQCQGMMNAMPKQDDCHEDKMTTMASQNDCNEMLRPENCHQVTMTEMSSQDDCNAK